ncbi:hypothetical protein [Actinomadura violacea]|uniref:Uncharacterized protein n=1 Tax=Actinomadura violacea TaxID=2819934 RepID=A0ABS3RYA3_9ACTN|nr:hypothetical protein [Actinomadura violacea]MBO2461687.1 hypothetical protein [Actinomadura violacea]
MDGHLTLDRLIEQLTALRDGDGGQTRPVPGTAPVMLSTLDGRYRTLLPTVDAVDGVVAVKVDH